MKNEGRTCKELIVPDLIESETIMAQKYSVPERDVRMALYQGISNMTLGSSLGFVRTDKNGEAIYSYAPLQEAEKILKQECALHRAKIKRAEAGMIYNPNKVGKIQYWGFSVMVAIWIKGRFENKWIKILKVDRDMFPQVHGHV